MTWWGWLLLWTVLVLGALAVHGLLVRRLWRQFRALGRELSAAADRFTTLTERLEHLEDARSASTSHPGGVGSPRAGRPVRPDEL